MTRIMAIGVERPTMSSSSPNQFICARWRVCNLLSDSLWCVIRCGKPCLMNMPVARAPRYLCVGPLSTCLVHSTSSHGLREVLRARNYVAIFMHRWRMHRNLFLSFFFLLYSRFALIFNRRRTKLNVCGHCLCVAGVKIPAVIR